VFQWVHRQERDESHVASAFAIVHESNSGMGDGKREWEAGMDLPKFGDI
jgi:hypothetical protein